VSGRVQITFPFSATKFVKEVIGKELCFEKNSYLKVTRVAQISWPTVVQH